MKFLTIRRNTYLHIDRYCAWTVVLLLSISVNPLKAQSLVEDSLRVKGKLLTRQGHYQQAIRVFGSLLAKQRQLHPHDNLPLVTTFILLGRASFRQRNYENAYTYFTQALRIQLKKYKHFSDQNTHLYINLASTCQKLKQYTKALDYAQKALTSYPKGNYNLYNTLGMSYYDKGKFDAALYYYRKALRFKNRAGLLNNIGDAYLKLGQPLQALKYYKQATRDSLPFYTQVSIMYRKARAWHAQAGNTKTPSQKRNKLNTKAADFLHQADSLLKSRQHTLRDEKDKLVLGQWIQSITELGLTVSYRLYQLATTKTQQRYWQSQVFYFGERQKASILLDDVTNQRMTSIIQLPQVQKQLNDSTAVLSYSFGKDALYAFAITKGQILLKALPQDSVKKHWRSYNLYIHVLLVKECVHYMHQFYRWLVAPLYPVVGHKHRWLIAGGELNTVPFETFCKRQGVDTKKVAPLNIDYQKFPYLIWQHAISYASSATLAFLSIAPRTYQQQFFGVAPGTYQDPQKYPPLKHAPQEVKAIAQMITQSKQTLLGEAATRQQVLQKGRAAKWLHFATHGVFNWKEDLNGILLYDGQWLLKDIQNLKLQNDLVVMSSCSAAAGKFIKGEGLVAMTRSFLRAGARNILYTLWSVNDRLAARLMTSFYKYLIQGKGYAEALRQAKLEFLRDPKPVYGYPGLWSVFLLEGRFLPSQK